MDFHELSTLVPFIVCKLLENSNKMCVLSSEIEQLNLLNLVPDLDILKTAESAER